MAISITPSPFGSVTVTLDGELGGVLSVGVLATSNSSLDMAIGTPGPQGEQGEPGANGQNGTNGVGVPVGGTAGQVLSKINSTNYNTQWTTPSGGTWGSITGTLNSQTDLQNALNGKLSLTSGTMSGDITFSVDGNGNDSLIGAFGFGVENTSGQVAYIQPDVFRIYDNDHLTGTSVNGEGITFNDSTVQTTAGLPLTGGTVTNGDTRIELSPDDNWLAVRDNVDIQGVVIYPSGINFRGLGIQTEPALPLTGGTMTGAINQSLSGNQEVNYYAQFNLDGDNYGNYRLGLNNNLSGGQIELNGNGGTLIKFVVDNDQLAEGSFKLNGVGLTLSRTGINFPDGTNQVTAFPPSGGTTAQYIDGTGALQTYGPLGDRYFTTSNSTLTCDSGNGKTMTVGTGLSYSRQQDITVSYNNANHMHGTVLTYDSGTGVMTFDSNTHSGGGTYSSWEVNVGGVAGAVLPVGGTSGQVLAKINSTNFNTEWISLGSMSTEPASAYLSTASAVANYQTISGMSAYLSTAAAASTYQTQSGMSAYLSTAAASANFIGTSAYATNLQAVQNTSSTTVLSPANSRFVGISTNVWSAGVDRLSSATSGTGASAGSTVTSLNGALVSASALTAGYATRGFNLFYPSNSVTSGYNYGTESGHSVRVYANWNNTVTGVKLRSVFGRMSAALPVPATLAARGYGWEYDYSTKVISIIAHNGTSLTTTAQTWASTANRTYDIAVYSNGTGTISLYIDGTLIGTGTGGPTTTSTTGQIWWQLEIENQSTAASQQTIYYQNPKVITTNG